MIPRAAIGELADRQGLRETIVEKDYVLGWVLYGISRHPRLGRWVFKGGTCLKKCFFETYRLSEDLDFTIPEGQPCTLDSIRSGLEEVVAWVETETGIQFPAGDLGVKESVNKRGRTCAGAGRRIATDARLIARDSVSGSGEKSRVIDAAIQISSSAPSGPCQVDRPLARATGGLRPPNPPNEGAARDLGALPSLVLRVPACGVASGHETRSHHRSSGPCRPGGGRYHDRLACPVAVF